MLVALALAAGPGLSFQDEEEERPAARVAARVPQIAAVFPMGAEPGASVSIDVRGEFLEGVDRAVFTTPDVTAQVRSAEWGRVDLAAAVSPGAEPGPRYFRLVSKRGASNLLLFRVSRWRSAVESEPNDRLDAATSVEWPAMVSGRLENPRDVDLYRFRARRGEKVALHLLAIRNWSNADLSLAILDPRGRAVRQDEGTFIWEPYIPFDPPADGDYVAAVMLTRMPAGGQSGADLLYQLAGGPAPLVRSAFPLYVQSGAEAALQLRGEWLDGITEYGAPGLRFACTESSPSAVRIAARMSLAPDREPIAIGVKHPAGFAAPVSILVGADPAYRESRSNDTAETAEPITLPVVVNGTIEEGHDDDFYRFEARAGETLVFEARAEELGSRLDARLELLDGAGKRIAFNDDGKRARGALKWDPALEQTFKEAGSYVVKISSQQRRGSADHVYTLAVRRASPALRVTLGAERLTLERGGKATWNVALERIDGFQGDVTIEARGLPPGVAAKPVVVSGDGAAGKLELTAREDAALEARPVEITARAAIGGREVCLEALAPAARVTGSGPVFAPYRSTEAWLTVVEPPLFSLEASVSEVVIVRGGTAELGVKVARRGGFDGAIEFALHNAPAGVTVEKAESIDKGRLARLTLRAREDVPLGRSSVTILGSGGGRREPAPRMSLQIN